MAKIKKHTSKNTKLFIVTGFTVCLIYLLMLYLPCLWGITQTFKSRYNWMEDKLGLPTKFVLTNYKTFFKEFYISVIQKGQPKKIYMDGMLLYTLIYGIGGAFMSFVVKFTCTYALFKYKQYIFSKIFYSIILVAMYLPLAGGLSAELALYHRLNVYDNLFVMSFLRGNVLGFYVLIFYASFFSVPVEMYEAAEIDGASRLTIMLRIVMPMVKGVIVLFFLTEFIGTWNSYTTVLFFLPSYPMIGYGLYDISLKTSPPEVAHATVKLTAAFVVAVPMIILLICFGNLLMQNISITEGIKG